MGTEDLGHQLFLQEPFSIFFSRGKGTQESDMNPFTFEKNRNIY